MFGLGLHARINSFSQRSQTTASPLPPQPWTWPPPGQRCPAAPCGGYQGGRYVSRESLEGVATLAPRELAPGTCRPGDHGAPAGGGGVVHVELPAEALAAADGPAPDGG